MIVELGHFALILALLLVIVNGTVVVEDATHTGALPGKVLRRDGDGRVQRQSRDWNRTAGEYGHAHRRCGRRADRLAIHSVDRLRKAVRREDGEPVLLGRDDHREQPALGESFGVRGECLEHGVLAHLQQPADAIAAASSWLLDGNKFDLAAM